MAVSWQAAGAGRPPLQLACQSMLDGDHGRGGSPAGPSGEMRRRRGFPEAGARHATQICAFVLALFVLGREATRGTLAA